MKYLPLTERQIAWRAAQDVSDGTYVNLGIGIPTLIANYVPEDREVIYHSENGILGMGPEPMPGEEDPDLINAGKFFVTLLKGGCFFDSSLSFVMIRGGHLDLVFLGAFQVSEKGDIANWTTGDERTIPSVGGAIDLAVGCEDVRVLMRHTTKTGEPKIVKECTYPLTAKKVVKRIYTDLAVIDVTEKGMIVREIINGYDFDKLKSVTAADLILDENWKYLIAPEI